MPPQSYKRFLVRDYIKKSLYDPIHGYFSNTRHPVLQHEIRPRLRDIPSRKEYQKTVAATYASSEHGWMTPVELFSPFLSRAIANRIQKTARSNDKLHIIEIGAGRGTLALDILEHWSKFESDLLRNVCYHIVEISPALAHLQCNVLRRWIDREIVTVHNSDVMVWLKTLGSNPAVREELLNCSCHIVGAEVLDNLPHDLVREGPSGLEQAVIVTEGKAAMMSRKCALEWTTDIDKDTLAAMHGLHVGQNRGRMSESSSTSLLNSLRGQFEQLLGGGIREIWVPTTSYQLLHSLTSELPHCDITISDFDSFAGALPGENGPVVQSIDRGSAVVFDGVESAPFGKVDIMFPTDFFALQRAHEGLSEREGRRYSRRIISQQQFYEEYYFEEDMNDSTCADGYNPILEDFENVSYLLVDCVDGIEASS